MQIYTCIKYISNVYIIYYFFIIAQLFLLYKNYFNFNFSWKQVTPTSLVNVDELSVID